ncbi:MAG: carbamoyltransferase HypF [Deferribacteraceae bacterium]|jgi:hydrogenase maturation protein HypF|nr:carbamoyltransferase HypF [Deferribacteraceae bacterium]
MTFATYKINITGVVQGVGFRPFVANLARELSIMGTVQNTGSGVEIFSSATKDTLNIFAASLKDKRPPQSHIAEFDLIEVEYTAFEEFTILPSVSRERAAPVFIPTDLATCPECSIELADPANRRYKYPFINCTQCGPRYSIINSLPYDRVSTTMEQFKMCPECQSEYDNPADRRYHAQPNACPVCGPQVWIGGLKGVEAIEYTANLIDSGEIIAMKGLGGYHLICDATNSTAIRKLREYKRRNTKPLAVMCQSLSDITIEMDEELKGALTSVEAPIVIIDWQNHPLSELINPLSNDIGVMLAYTPLHKILLNTAKTNYIVATSGNKRDEPIAASVAEAEEALSEFTPHFLHHNRPITNRIDDSVATKSAGRVRLLRRGRGFAPFPTTADKRTDKIIFAAGAQLKSSISFTKGAYTFVSQYIGDLDNAATVDFYTETYNNMRRILNAEPQIVVCDKHEGYHSTSFAKSLGLPLLQLQHHHAHLYAVMAEYKLTDNVIGLIADGTGYGDDGSIWGCEVFALQNGVISRDYHLEYVPQVGGDASVRYPSRMAQSWLTHAGVWSEELQERMGITAEECKLTNALIKSNINTIPTSSAGRLFESVGAMVLRINKNEYEAHAAMALEAIANDNSGRYSFELQNGNILLAPAIQELTQDIIDGTPLADISAKFHNTFAESLVECAKKIACDRGITDVALSGGVFQNKKLLERVEKLLVKAGLNCYIPIRVPSNDGGISLGQAYWCIINDN